MPGNAGGIARHALMALLLILMALVFFDRLTFSDFVLARGDTFAYFYPYWEARNAALMAGHLPLWSPDLFMGVPLLANSQLGTFYPPNWFVAPLSAPQGVRLSILAHVAWALVGVYALARRSAGLERAPALLAAVVFAFGGYLGARVEQINQLQGLSWLPWTLLLLHHAPRRPALYVPLLAGALALQVFTGHTQTVFITTVGLAVVAVVGIGDSVGRRYRQTQTDAMNGVPTGSRVGTPFMASASEPMPSVPVPNASVLNSPDQLRLLILLIAGILALVLALPQLVPTLELTGISHRGGGLNPNEATAFSFNPFLAGRGLLPSYDLPIFAEYIAYPGIIALGLALVGVIWGGRRGAIYPTATGAQVGMAHDTSCSHQCTVWIVLAVVGVFFAFGQYNPVYAWLAQFPGFNLFRVPARWLALFALGVAMLAGIGLQALPTLRSQARLMAGGLALAVVVVLAAGAWLLTARNPEPVPATPPEMMTLVGWGAAVVGLIALLVMVRNSAQRELKYLLFLFALLIVLLELWLAARALPYNQLVPPDVVSGQRFTLSHMRVYAARETPPGRLLSISNLLFDPGDRAALEARYAALGMSAAEVRTALVAIKMQEVVAANLPLLWGIPSIDGFDGGVLPTTWYSAFASLLTPPDALRTVDGRLREILAREECGGVCLPDARWLALTNTRYLLMDKIYDLWHDDVAYDTGIRVSLSADDETIIMPARFEATAVDLLVEGGAPSLTITREAGEEIVLEGARHWDADALRTVWRYTLPAPAIPAAILVRADDGAVLHALTLVDTRANVFQQATLGDWRRVLSSDIKLYENLAVLPRAFVVHDALVVGDDYLGTEDALSLLRDPAFDPARSVVLAETSPREAVTLPASDTPLRIRRGDGGEVLDGTHVTAYAPTRLEIAVESEAAGYLVLSDAYYEGWQAAVNGSETPILRANIMFRAVPIPAGESTVVMEYRPWWVGWLPVMGSAWFVVAIGAAWGAVRRTPRHPSRR